MRNIRAGFAGLIGLLGLALWAGVPAAQAAEPEAAETFISTLTNEAVQRLTDKNTPRAERARRLSVIMHERFAGKKIARWILGRHWRKATPAQRERYLNLYVRLMVESYVDRFTNYTGEKLEVLRADRYDEKDIMVKTVMQRPGGKQPVKIDWRVRDTEGRLRVLDIMVEGVSMAVAQRAEFSSALRHAGNDIDAFLDELQERAERLAAAGGS